MKDYKKEIQDLKSALSEAHRKIERLSQRNDDLIPIISHELKTPLTSIKESVNLLLDGIAGPVNEEQKKFLNIAKNNIERLTRLINDIFDFSKLKVHRMIMHRRKMDLNSLIKDVYSLMEHEIEERHMRCELRLFEKMESVWIDPERITQVLKNLISNAIKFGRDSGTIKIYTNVEDIDAKRFMKVIVEDDGIGIPADEIGDIFKGFSQIDTSLTRKHSGIGLGLAISKGIVELHGGDIYVLSEEGEGSRFIFTLPLYREDEEFDFLLEEAMERSRYSGIKLALIIFRVKDGSGDVKIIQEIEETLKKIVRGPEDRVVKYKKGEFVVIMAGTDRQGAMAIIERLKKNIKYPLYFGLSIYPDDAEEKEGFIKKAEEDLEKDKKLIIPETH